MMNWETELKWAGGFLFVTVVLVGLITEFRFNSIELQLHDRYFVFGAAGTIFRLTFTLYTIKNLYQLVDIITLKYRVLALLFAIVNPIAGLVLLVFTIMIGMLNLTFPIEGNPSPIFSGLILSILLLQVFLEIKMVQRLKSMMDD